MNSIGQRTYISTPDQEPFVMASHIVGFGQSCNQQVSYLSNVADSGYEDRSWSQENPLDMEVLSLLLEFKSSQLPHNFIV